MWPGPGRSGRPRDTSRVGITDHASDLWSVLDGLGIERAALFGHSMGTQVCLEAWRAHPERTAGLGLGPSSMVGMTATLGRRDSSASAGVM